MNITKKYEIQPIRTGSGFVIEVKIKWLEKNIEVSFIKINKIVQRKDLHSGYVKNDIYIKMKRIAWKIFSENDQNKSNEKITKPRSKTPSNIIHPKSFFGNERNRLSLLMKYKIFVSEDGQLIIKIKNHGKDSFQYFKNISSAIRGQDHTVENYLNNNNLQLCESKKLKSIIEVANESLLFFQKKIIDKNSEEAIQQKILESTETLEKCRDLLKLDALDQMIEILPMLDILERKNPGALSARAVSVKSKIKKRSKNIKNIILFVEARKQTLVLEEKRIIINLYSALNKVNTIINSLSQNNNVDRNLNQVLYFLQSCWVEPYFSINKDITKIIMKAKKEMNKEKYLIEAKNLLELFLNKFNS